MRGTWGEGSDRHVIDVSGNGEFLLEGSIRGTQGLNKGGFFQYVYCTRLLSFSRIQSRVVTDLLSGHSTLTKHRCIVGLIDRPLCWRCGAEQVTSDYV